MLRRFHDIETGAGPGTVREAKTWETRKKQDVGNACVSIPWFGGAVEVPKR